MNIHTLINENYEKLNKNDLHIWNYIQNNKKECTSININELAKRCNISHTSILRFTKKLGLTGYSELKLYLKYDSEKKANIEEIQIESVYNDIVTTLDLIKNRDCEYVFKLLDNARKLYAYGTGSIQKSATKQLKNLLLNANKLLNVIEGREETKIIMNSLSENDIFFLISLSGNNEFMNKFVRELKNKAIKIISITQNSKNELAELSDVNIYFYAHHIQKDLQPTSLFFIVNEILILKYIQYINLKSIK